MTRLMPISRSMCACTWWLATSNHRASMFFLLRSHRAQRINTRNVWTWTVRSCSVVIMAIHLFLYLAGFILCECIERMRKWYTDRWRRTGFRLHVDFIAIMLSTPYHHDRIYYSHDSLVRRRSAMVCHVMDPRMLLVIQWEFLNVIKHLRIIWVDDVLVIRIYCWFQPEVFLVFNYLSDLCGCCGPSIFYFVSETAPTQMIRISSFFGILTPILIAIRHPVRNHSAWATNTPKCVYLILFALEFIRML